MEDGGWRRGIEPTNEGGDNWWLRGVRMRGCWRGEMG